MNTISRRGFLGSILAAPAIVKADIPTPARTIWKPESVGASTTVGVDLANGPDRTGLFRGELGQFDRIRIIRIERPGAAVLEAAALAQAWRFSTRVWAEADVQPATGKPLLLHPEDDWLRALKGPAR